VIPGGKQQPVQNKSHFKKIMKTPTYLKQLVTLTLALMAASAVHANLVINGGFETHGPYNTSGWNYFYDNPVGVNPVTGWSAGGLGIPLEVGRPSVYGVTGVGLGDAVMELDTTMNVVATQPLATTASASYTLSFLYALRQNVVATSGTLEVYWNGGLVTSLSPTLNSMTLYSTLVTAIGNDVLEFRGTGTSDSYGALIDNVALVPEPTTVLAGALLLLPFGASTIRFLRKNRTA
jgi:hypothetical protein